MVELGDMDCRRVAVSSKLTKDERAWVRSNADLRGVSVSQLIAEIVKRLKDNGIDTLLK
jgi:hypothetical protein